MILIAGEAHGSILSDQSIAGLSFADFSIKLNHLNTLLGLDGDTYNSLIIFNAQNIALVDEVYNGLTASQNLGACDKEDCGLVGGYHEYIRATIGGLVLSSTDLESLLDTYSLLRCENPSLYSCLRTVQQGSESQTFEGCFSNAFNNYCLVEFDGSDNVVDASVPILIPFSCESFPLTQIGTYTYRTTVLDWRPKFGEWTRLPLGMGVYKKEFELGAYSFDIEVTGVPGEAECEIQNLVAEAFNNASIEVMRFIGLSLAYKMPGGEETLRLLMETDLQTKLAVHFPFGAFVNIPAIDESVGQSLIDNIPGFEVVDCC